MKTTILLRTGLHEVAVGGLYVVAKYLVSYTVVERNVVLKQGLACPSRPVVPLVGSLDALLDENAQHVRRQVNGQHDVVDPVVVVQHVYTQTGVVHRLAFRP